MAELNYLNCTWLARSNLNIVPIFRDTEPPPPSPHSSRLLAVRIILYVPAIWNRVSYAWLYTPMTFGIEPWSSKIWDRNRNSTASESSELSSLITATHPEYFITISGKVLNMVRDGLLPRSVFKHVCMYVCTYVQCTASSTSRPGIAVPPICPPLNLLNIYWHIY